MQVTGSLQTVATYLAVAHPFLQPISVGIQERTEALFLIFVSHFFQPSLQDFLVRSLLSDGARSTEGCATFTAIASSNIHAEMRRG
jgi:hypothetical protein